MTRGFTGTNDVPSADQASRIAESLALLEVQKSAKPWELLKAADRFNLEEDSTVSAAASKGAKESGGSKELVAYWTSFQY